MLSPPGALTLAELAKAKGAIPDSWGIIPRTMLHCLSDPRISLHASAIEVYGDAVLDLLDSSKLIKTKSTMGARMSKRAFEGHLSEFSSAKGDFFMHPSSCSCRECFAAVSGKATSSKVSKSTPSLNQPNPPPKDAAGSSNLVAGTFSKIATPEDVATFCRQIELTRYFCLLHHSLIS